MVKPYDFQELADEIVFADDIHAKHVVSIDPGAVHCGVALWRQPNGEVDETGQWECVWAIEMTPDDCVDFVWDVGPRAPGIRIAIEGFWLKPGKAALQQAGSSMETVEIIGVVRHICRRHGIPFTKVANGQDAIATRLKAAGYKFRSYGYGDHAKDAECVGSRALALKVRQIKLEK